MRLETIPAVLIGAALLALTAAILFGVALVLTHRGLRHTNPLHGALVSIPTAASLLWLLSPFAVRLADWNGDAAMIFLGIGALFPASVTVLTFEANRRLGPSVTGTLGSVTPLFAVAWAILFLGEQPTMVQGAAILAVVTGIALIAFDPKRRNIGSRHWPLALPIVAAAIRGLVQAVGKFGLALWPNPFAATFIGYTASSLVVVVAAAILLRKSNPLVLRPAALLWFGLVGLCNGTAVLFLYAALSRGSVVLVAPLVATYPFVTLGISAAMRSVIVTRCLLVGIVLTVVGGIVLVFV